MMVKRKPRQTDPEYDVAISFAGEDRGYVETVAGVLRDRGVKVFYDRYEEVQLWGKDLYAHLDDVYRKKARYCVLFVSASYRDKLWTNHERRSAQARAFGENREYILPVRFDDTEIPGMPPTVGYVDATKHTPHEVAELTCTKVGVRQPEEVVPKRLDRLWRRLKCRNAAERERVKDIVWELFDDLKLMSPAERRLVWLAVLYGCHEDLPDNVHMDLNFLRRLSGWTLRRVERVLDELDSLGVSAVVEERPGFTWSGAPKKRPDRMVVFEKHSRSASLRAGNVTKYLAAVAEVIGENYCGEHALQVLVRLDFTGLGKS